MKTKPVSRVIHWSTNAAPWLSVVILAAMSWALPNRVGLTRQAQDRKVEIAAAMKAVPRFIGPWTGVDAKVPREAQELLRPNAILSRTYRKTGGPRIHLLVVHCGDARDMIGHYPPICYPSSGWVPRPDAASDDAFLSVSGRLLPVRIYYFNRTKEHGGEESIRIFNVFVLPDGNLTRDIADINQQSERLEVSVQGVAQLQLIMSAQVSLPVAQDAAGELLAGMPSLRKALRIVEDEGVIGETIH